MFDKIKNWFIGKGAKLGMVKELTHVTDHEKISVGVSEYNRIEENKRMYKAKYDDVIYINSNGDKKKRPLHSINIAKVIAHKLSKLIFNEGISVGITGSDKVDKFVQAVLEDNNFRSSFGEQLEAGYAIGGVAIRPFVDDEDRIRLSYAQADSFFPLSSNTSEVEECTFTFKDEVREGKDTYFYTLFEFHEFKQGVYTITNELYKSDKVNKIGHKVALSSLDKYQDLEPVAVLEGFTRPLFVYIKLAGKNNVDLNSPLSLGIVDNSKQQFRDINEKYDMFMHEIKNAQRKITATDHFFKTDFDSQGKPVTKFGDDTDVYQVYRGGIDDAKMQEFAPDLRSAEFIESINFILRIIEMQTGFSAGTFSFDGQSVKTATEVVSENAETYSTRQDNVLIVARAIKQLVLNIIELAQYYDLISLENKDVLHINVDFDDGVFESKDAKLEYYGKANTLNLMPTTISMQKAFGIDEAESLKWFRMRQLELRGLDPVEWQVENEADTFGAEE